MSTGVSVQGIETAHARDHTASMRAIAARMAEQTEEIARRMVVRYRDEIVEYRVADEEFLFGDVYGVSLDNLEALLRNLLDGRTDEVPDEQLENTRASAARRLRQGISLESFLHAGRLWGQITWETVLATARADEPAEREAALQIAGAVLRHVDHMSAVIAAAYLAEVEGLSSDREVLRRDLLDVLISGKGDCERIRRLARSLRLTLSDSYVVVVLREDDTPADASLRRLVDAARRHLDPEEGSVLIGVRQGEVVALYPAPQPADGDAMAEQCAALAAAVPEAIIGIGLWHQGMAAIGVGYEEATEAVTIAQAAGVRGRPVVFDEVLIDHMVRSSAHGDRILDGTLRPLLEYDAERHAELVPTLRAYVTCGFNLTKSADQLNVHPNTVVYRLRRIKELSGRDPHDPDDLLLLFLGLKLDDLSSAP